MAPVRYFSSIPPGDAGTLGHTVPWMHRLIREGAQDPTIRAMGRQFQASSDPVNAAFRFVQGLPYKHDPDEYEMLQGAPWLLRQAKSGLGYSDCDCRVILLGSLLESMGYRTRLVLIRAPGKDSFSHVYQEVWYGGRWVPLDTIFSNFRPGDEVRDITGTKTVIPRPGGLGGDWGLVEKLPHYQPAIELAAQRFGAVAEKAGLPGLKKGLSTVPDVTAAITLAATAKAGAILLGLVFLALVVSKTRQR